jgi:hypothetical protein
VPPIHREGALRFVIWSNDHRPPHIHVITPDGEAVIELAPVALRDEHGMRERDVARAVEITRMQWRAFLDQWRRIHG